MRVTHFSLSLIFLSLALDSKPSEALPEVTSKAKAHHRTRRKQKIATASSAKPISLSSHQRNIRNDQNAPSPISVQAMLIPRLLKVQSLIQLVCLGVSILSVIECINTAGYPHIQTIFRLINGDKAKMPSSYRPSSFDIQLAQLLASASKEMIPAIAMPKTNAILGMLFSIVGFFATILLPRWFTNIRVAWEYRKVDSALEKDMTSTSLLLRIDDPVLKQEFMSTSQEGDGMESLICKLQTCPQRSSSKKQKQKQGQKNTTRNLMMGLEDTHPSPYFFEFNQGRFYFESTSMTCADGGPMLHKAFLSDLQALVKHGLSKRQRLIAKERYRPYNEPKLASPTIKEAFYARLSSPLVVVQLIGRLLSILEDGWRSLLNTGMTLSQHYVNARQAIISAKEMAQEVQTSVKDTSSLKVKLYDANKKKWIATSASELLPGDIFLLPSSAQNQEEFIFPVDALLLDGQCLTNEAVLTGESVPQSKLSIDFEEAVANGNDDACLDMNDHRSSILFAGTTLVHTTKSSRLSAAYDYMPFSLPKESGMICLALRTGTYSSKGQLLRSLKSGTHVGAISNPESERDSIRLIACLSVFALASCISLFIPRGDHVGKPIPAYRRVIQCTRIACASIPSELPLSLSAVAKSCSKKLREESDVVCSEPGALLTAAYIDTVVFDKTGTLTADTQALSKLVTKLPGLQSETKRSFQRFILAACHSLVSVGAASGDSSESSLVGDPLELAALDYSGWKYNQTDDSYGAGNKSKMAGPVRLWQIKSFPFDPSKRLSSALVLAQHADNTCRLWSLTKGSPDSIINLQSNRHDPKFKEAYAKTTQELEVQGYRSIAMASKDLTNSSLLVDTLFPNGLSCDQEAINLAKSQGLSLHRSDFEAMDGSSFLSAGLDLSGFACFDAALRTSSTRIIGEIRRGGIKAIMLTGDAIDAALAVSQKVDLIRERQIAILELKDGAMNGELMWRIVKLKPGKKASFKAFHEASQSVEVTKASMADVIKRHQDGKCAVAATGQALERVLDESSDGAAELLADNLSCLSVIARATPALKKSVITCLKDRCGQKVMMCGDGCNDLGAMKAADVAVALLNGFGSEESFSDDKDIDDERRSKKLEGKRLGRNRQKKPDLAKRKESRERMDARIEKAKQEIDKRVSERDQKDYDFEDMKDMISATMQAAASERRRAKSLKVGGGDAARILAEERQNRTAAELHDDAAVSTIKPGEASLVAAFSCLHPSIDGVEAILRAGVATAASALSSKKIIALHSLMSAYHLASLYRDGCRYGKHMWTIELFMFAAVDQARYNAACISRPRLPSSKSSRPSASMFHPSCIFSTLAQATIHLVCMNFGVNYGRKLETGGANKPNKSTLRLSSGSPFPVKAGKLLSALAAQEWGAGSQENEEANDDGTPTGLFRRRPFRPNFETNAVFLFSILQSAIGSIVNHQGKPFYRSILESQLLCFHSLLNILFPIALVLESFPLVNRFLELRSLPLLGNKLSFLGIVFFNVAACAIVQRLSDLWFREKMASETVRRVKKKNAADLEEELLQEETKENTKTVFLASGIGIYLIADMILKHKLEPGD